jgi:hypothetical protein
MLSLLSDVGWEKELSRLGRGCVVKRRARDSILFPLSLSYDSLLTLKLTAFQDRLLIRQTQRYDSSSLEKPATQTQPHFTSPAFLLLPSYLTQDATTLRNRLPHLRLPNHPTTQKQQHQHPQKWPSQPAKPNSSPSPSNASKASPTYACI